jgi:Protein of unknown function (DUF3618)
MFSMADGDGVVATRDPDALVKEIERTRENLARTIDTLTERVSPANAAHRAIAAVREQAARPEVRRTAGVAAAAVAAVAVAAYLLRRRR